MLDNPSGLLGRSALERLIGVGRFFFTDSGGTGRTGRLMFPCGCEAEEAEPERYAVRAACGVHRDKLPESGRS